MNERETANRIKNHLNYGLPRIDPSVSEGLSAARQRALAAFEPQHAHGYQLAGAGAPGEHFHGVKHHLTSSRWLSIALLLAALAGGAYWYQQNQEDDIDALLLSGDLPVNAYLDHGFHSWLERTSPR